MVSVQYKKTTLAVLGSALLVVAHALLSAPANSATVAFLDVGQGDAIVATMPGNVQVLIDGGPSDTVVEKLSRYMPFYDKRIELIVLTHPHADHLRGLSAVLEHYEVERALISGAVYDSATYRSFLESLEAEGTRVYRAEAGNVVRFPSFDSELRVLAPTSSFWEGIPLRHIHESNVVTVLRVGEFDFLLMGDADTKLEEELVTFGVVEDVEVLKVGHQGSKTSSGEAFLGAARAEIGVIEVGKNSYGHPHKEVLSRLEERGMRVFRTDEHGDVIWRFQRK